MNIKVGVTDDEQLFLKSLSLLISRFSGFEVVIEALGGKELLDKLAVMAVLPDILLVDVRMKGMDGIQTVKEVTEKYPAIRIAALSSQDDDATVIQMIRAGCCAYLFKGIHPLELEKALSEIKEKGYYNADLCNVNARRLVNYTQEESQQKFSERQLTFIRLSCSDLTYRQIAAEMGLSERTIDGYREAVFEKMNVESRVGMVLEAIRKGLFVL